MSGIQPSSATAALPNLVVIGAMKCGTSAVHRYLDGHPQIAMCGPKELNFFVGPEDAQAGNWYRGLDWYAAHFDASAPVAASLHPATPRRPTQGLPALWHRSCRLRASLPLRADRHRGARGAQAAGSGALRSLFGFAGVDPNAPTGDLRG